MGTKPKALIVDDGELELARALLYELGVPFWHLRASNLKPPVPDVERLLITTSQAAVALRHERARPKPDEPPTWIAFVPSDSKSQRRLLRSAGFDFLVPYQVHPAALRLLITRALYDGDNTQRVTRVPFGAEITYIGRLRRHKGILVDISPRGCRLLTSKPPKRGARVTIQIPDAEDGALQLRGTVLRTAPAKGEGGVPGEVSVGMQFDTIEGVTRERLKKLLVEGLTGPRAFGDGGRLRYMLPDVPESMERDREAPAQPRALFEREIDVFSAGTTRVLMGRALWEGGMRIKHNPGLVVGERLRLALPTREREEPLLIEAHVASEDDQGVLVLFDWMEPAMQERLRRLIHTLPKIRRLEDDTGTHTVVPARMLPPRRGK